MSGGLPARASKAVWWSAAAGPQVEAWSAAGFAACLDEARDIVVFTRTAGAPAVTPPRLDWDRLSNEAAVEFRVVLPLLRSLGYADEDIAPQAPVDFHTGGKRTRGRADFVVFDGPVHSSDTALIVVEAKGPTIEAGSARDQAESYARAARAPLVLLCSATEIELWQACANLELIRIEAWAVSSIETERGSIERRLRREAVVAYCQSLKPELIGGRASDFSPYALSELERIVAVDARIDRRLSGLDRMPRSSAELFDEGFVGVVILASSGMGKTTLAESLHRQALEARSQGETALSVLIEMPEVDGSLTAFAQARLEAHKPGITAAVFQDLVRHEGLILICDGFDRLDGPDQRRREREFKALIRDFPKLRLVVLSRPSAPPDLTLPKAYLEALSDEEIRAVASLRIGEEAFQFSPPPRLHDLCANPLILNLVLDQWTRDRTYPARLQDLFSAWLERTLGRDPLNLSGYHRRLRAMTTLALVSVGGRVSLDDGVRALEGVGSDPVVLDELVGSGALLATGGETLSFEHEGLVDYLKAKHWATQHHAETAGLIDGLADEASSSFLPILLMALLSDAALQTKLWDMLGRGKVNVYLDAMRYRAVDWLEVPTDADAERMIEDLIEDLIEGVEHPLQCFFPSMRAAVERELTREPGEGLAVTGLAGTDSATYGFHRPAGPRVSFADPDTATVSYVNLVQAGLTLASGRVLGLSVLRKALGAIFKSRQLKGGDLWRSERLRIQLPLLAQDIEAAPATDDPLRDWRAALEPYAGLWTCDADGEYVAFDDLIADLDALIDSGVERLEADALTPGWSRQTDLDMLKPAVALHYDRTMALYAELVQANFAETADQLGLMVCLPIRRSVNIEMAHGDLYVTQHWTPVQVGAVEATIVTSDDDRPEMPRDHGRFVQGELLRLGRSTDHARIEWGWSAVRSLEPRATERSPVSAAVKLLQQDVDGLFRHAPERDTQRRRPSANRTSIVN